MKELLVRKSLFIKSVILIIVSSIAVYGFTPERITISPTPINATQGLVVTGFNSTGNGVVTVTLTGTISVEDARNQSFEVRLLDIDASRNDVLGKTIVTPPPGDVFRQGELRTFVLRFEIGCQLDLSLAGTETSAENNVQLALQIEDGPDALPIYFDNNASNGITMRCQRQPIFSTTLYSPWLAPIYGTKANVRFGKFSLVSIATSFGVW